MLELAAIAVPEPPEREGKGDACQSNSHCMQLNSHCMQLDGHCMQVLREVVAASAAPNGGTRLTLIDLGSSLTDEQLENSVQARSYMPKFSLSYPDF